MREAEEAEDLRVATEEVERALSSEAQVLLAEATSAREAQAQECGVEFVEDSAENSGVCTVASENAAAAEAAAAHAANPETVRVAVEQAVARVRETNGHGPEEHDMIERSMITSTKVLYGALNLIKQDDVPRSFRERYLLSDFGLVPQDPIDTERASMYAYY